MGPLYGFMFAGMAQEVAGRPAVDAAGFSAMMNAALAGVRRAGSAQVGDKTLVDCLVPAVAAFDAARDAGFAAALEEMSEAAVKGRDSTVDLVAKVGRASRLGDRSRGVPDAGATSCCLILTTLAASFRKRLA
jgi:dihydroxyacetone kinase